jgi:putative tryptophan/tyrosine transport system substrate-binding protein
VKCSTIRSIIMLTLGLLVVPLSSEAQGPVKVRQIGVLSPSSPHPELSRHFRQGLRDLGWVEGQNLTIKTRYAEGRAERLPALAAELVRLQVEVMVVAGGTPAVRAAQNATRTIPIVGIALSDPVAAGFVASLARPEGNITGTVGLQPELIQRRLEVLKEAVPGLARLAVLLNRTHPSAVDQLHEAQGAAQAMGVALLVLEPQSPEEFAGAFATMQGARVDALLVFSDPFLLEQHRSEITALAQQHRLPAMYPHRMYVDAGGLMYYGTDLQEHSRRAAYYVDRILKGTKPADLPVETPWKFELVVNLKTAHAMGLRLSPPLLAQADEVLH